ncbi:MAG: AAA family ATPase [Gemmatimonadetes bacterium]|nr:AAA family ATPase [Gemmatimonadota bacterium]
MHNNCKPVVDRAVLRNYKSIAACDVTLGRHAFLVGPNGSGKSNFLDAIRFVSDSVRHSLDHALRDRGGINEVRRRSRGHPRHLAIRLDFNLDFGSGHYALEIAAKPAGAYVVKQEECHLRGGAGGSAMFRVQEGQVIHASVSAPPPAAKDRLYLVNVSGFDQFRGLYDVLSNMGFYSLNPEAIRDLQTPDPGELLNRDGSNIASVFGRLSAQHPDIEQRIEEYLSKVVAGVSSVRHKTVGPKETLEFRQNVRGDENPWRFLASSMSDGTLRAFAVLVALFQGTGQDSRPVRLVGIEEPEIALHPAAAGVLIDSIQDAAAQTQVIVTSHSPDLLDDEDLSEESILAVISESGETKIGPLDESGRQALRQHLYTAGELLRMDQLRPDPTAVSLSTEQLALFGPRGSEA